MPESVDKTQYVDKTQLYRVLQGDPEKVLRYLDRVLSDEQVAALNALLFEMEYGRTRAELDEIHHRVARVAPREIVEAFEAALLTWDAERKPVNPVEPEEPPVEDPEQEVRE